MSGGVFCGCYFVIMVGWRAVVSGEFGEVNKRSRGGVVMVGWVDGCGCGWRSEPVSQPCCSTVYVPHWKGKSTALSITVPSNPQLRELQYRYDKGE